MKLGIVCMALGTRMDEPQDGNRKTVVVVVVVAVVVVVVVFTSNRCFYPTVSDSAVHPVSVCPDSPFYRDANPVVTERKTKRNNRELIKEGSQIKC